MEENKNFDYKILDEKYENIRKSKMGNFMGADATYYITGVSGDIGSVAFGTTRGMYVCFDNFPGQQKTYCSEIPIKTWEDFESDLKRCGITLKQLKI